MHRVLVSDKLAPEGMAILRAAPDFASTETMRNT